jgi:DNA-binding MarR family transcriptional regulator
MSSSKLEDEIVVALRRIVRAIDMRSRRLVDEIGLTGPQLLVLREIAFRPGSSLNALARSVNLSQSTVSGVIDRLERQGLVKRDRGTVDRRTVLVTVTPEGGRILRDAPPLLQDYFRQELTRLQDWEQTQILATLQRIASMMDAESIDAAPVLTTGPISGAPNGQAKPAEPAESGSAPPDSRGEAVDTAS